MSTLTANYQFILPAVNNAIDANIWGGQLNTDWTSTDGILLAIDGGNIGNSAPSIPATAAPTPGMTWINNTSNPWMIQLYDGTEWVTTGTLNTVDHIYSNVGSVAVNIQVFPTAGSYTYTPSVGMSFCIVECIGAGGGSGGTSANTGSAGGGGGGGYAKQIYTAAAIGGGIPLVIGAGGTGGLPGFNAGNGGSTLFGTAGSLLNCTGGLAGVNGSVTSGLTIIPGGEGGISSGSLGLINVQGNQGGTAITQIGSFVIGGTGGGTPLGGTTFAASGTGSAISVNGIPGVNGSGAGSGASTFSGGTANGAAGGAGLIIITEYI